MIPDGPRSLKPWVISPRRLHDVEPLEGLEMLPPAQLSRLVAAKALRTVPYPLLGENTLVISDSIVLAPDDKGQLALIVRCASDLASTSSPLSYCHMRHLGDSVGAQLTGGNLCFYGETFSHPDEALV